eukprot:544318-Alexandrium_andersonii.AAC.1
MTAIDLCKCYGQINRWVLYMTLARSGRPVDVVTGYMTHVEGLSVYSEFASGAGMSRKREASIPQGR